VSVVKRRAFGLAGIAFLAAWSGFAAAADDPAAKAPRRVRVGLGAQAVPRYPGSDKPSLRPLVDVAVTRGDKPFEFEAPDESFGFSLTKGRVGIGPALGFEGSRTARDVGAPLDKVGFSVEAGAFVQYAESGSFRLRAEARKGLTGHEAWTGQIGADWIARDGDKWLVSLGPRATLSDGRYQRAYFGVTAAEAARTGLPAYRPGGGVQALGATAGAIRSLGGRWGVYGYAKYDRLVGDAARSPVVRAFGSRDQFSGGLALTYTFGG
jgi:outer membrane protein